MFYWIFCDTQLGAINWWKIYSVFFKPNISLNLSWLCASQPLPNVVIASLVTPYDPIVEHINVKQWKMYQLSLVVCIFICMKKDEFVCLWRLPFDVFVSSVTSSLFCAFFRSLSWIRHWIRTSTSQQCQKTMT